MLDLNIGRIITLGRIIASILLIGIIGIGIINGDARTVIDAGRTFEIVEVPTGPYPGNSFIDPSAVIEVLDLSNFSIGKESYIAPFVYMAGRQINVGNYTNIQDDVEIKGLLNLSDHVIIAHGAGLTGKVDIDEESFVGFNTYIQSSKIGKNVYIDHGSVIAGVNISDGKYVPAGSTINRQPMADNLSNITERQKEFIEEVILVNRALAIGYNKLYKEKGLDAFKAVGPNPDGNINVDAKDILARNGSSLPTIESGTEYDNVRIIGDVFIGEKSKIGNGTSIRSDEGIPIRIGKNALIGIGNVFHSLNNEEIDIGDNFKLGEYNVIHGLLKMGNNITIGSRSVVFKSNIGNDVIIGDKAIVTNVDIPDGTNINSSRKIISQDDLLENMQEDRKDNKGIEEGVDNKGVWNKQGKGVDSGVESGVEKRTPGFEFMIILGGISIIFLLRKYLKI